MKNVGIKQERDQKLSNRKLPIAELAKQNVVLYNLRSRWMPNEKSLSG
jgi:hypothetical protein